MFMPFSTFVRESFLWQSVVQRLLTTKCGKNKELRVLKSIWDTYTNALSKTQDIPKKNQKEHMNQKMKRNCEMLYSGHSVTVT